MATIEEIEGLKAEYNAAAAEQHARLTQLFEMIDTRKGYRRVRFSNGALWSNCWGREHRFVLPVTVDDMAQLITEIEPGTD